MTLLLGRLDDLVTNFRKITSVNRNVGFFTTGYNWMIQIIPALIRRPCFHRKEDRVRRHYSVGGRLLELLSPPSL